MMCSFKSDRKEKGRASTIFIHRCLCFFFSFSFFLGSGYLGSPITKHTSFAAVSHSGSLPSAEAQPESLDSLLVLLIKQALRIEKLADLVMLAVSCE
jgi:hypothetical protein